MHYCKMKGEGLVVLGPVLGIVRLLGGRGRGSVGGCRKSGNECEGMSGVMWILWLTLWVRLLFAWLGLWWSETAEKEGRGGIVALPGWLRT